MAIIAGKPFQASGTAEDLTTNNGNRVTFGNTAGTRTIRFKRLILRNTGVNTLEFSFDLTNWMPMSPGESPFAESVDAHEFWVRGVGGDTTYSAIALQH